MTSYIGVDLGGTKVLGVRIGEDGEIQEQIKFLTPYSPDELVPAAADAARKLWTDDVGALGAGVAGLVRWPEGVFAWGPHVAGVGTPVRAELEAELGVPVVVDNDANTAAFAETHLGAGRGFHHVLLVTLGTGIGGAIVIDGNVYRGRSFAGEIGHMILIPEGAVCDCGKRGCWETVASGPALARRALEVIARNPHTKFAERFRGVDAVAEEITRAAAEGDEFARSLVADVGEAFGRGLVNLIAILDPDVIVVGGGLGSVGESLVEPARRIVASRLHGGAHHAPPHIRTAELSTAAGAIGAALLARHHHTAGSEPRS